MRLGPLGARPLRQAVLVERAVEAPRASLASSASGTSRNALTASTRTARTLSHSSCMPIRTRSRGGSASSALAAPSRTSGSGSRAARSSAGSELGPRYEGSKVTAVPRTIPGCAASFTTASSARSASGWNVRPAWRAVA